MRSTTSTAARRLVEAACYPRSMSQVVRSERRLLDTLRELARDALGPGAPEAHVEFQARLWYEGAWARPRCPGEVRELCILWGIAPDPDAGGDWRAPGRDRKRRLLACRRTWARRGRGLQFVTRTGLLDRLEWAGNAVRGVCTRYYAALIDRVVAGDVASAVSAARRARDEGRVDIGYVQRIPSYEEVFGSSDE